MSLKNYIFSLILIHCFTFSLIQITTQTKPPIGGANGRISYGTLSNYGIVGNTYTNLGKKFSDVVCSLIGPNFVNVPNSKNCSNEKFLVPNTFHSPEEFCEFYNNACPSVKQCVTDRAIETNKDLCGITNLVIKIGKCCRNCDGELQK